MHDDPTTTRHRPRWPLSWLPRRLLCAIYHSFRIYSPSLSLLNGRLTCPLCGLVYPMPEIEPFVFAPPLDLEPGDVIVHLGGHGAWEAARDPRLRESIEQMQPLLATFRARLVASAGQDALSIPRQTGLALLAYIELLEMEASIPNLIMNVPPETQAHVEAWWDQELAKLKEQHP
jgi:hypothetical protein